MIFLQRSRKRMLSGIAALVMLFNVCAPALSHVVLAAPSGQDFLMEVCTTTGTKFIKLEVADLETQSHSNARSSSDCLSCSLSAHSIDRPPAYVLSAPALSALPSFLLAESLLPTLQARWIPSAPRAPPVSL